MSFSVSEHTGKMRDPCNLIGCGKTGSDGWQSSFGFALLGQAYEEDAWPALKKFFAKGHAGTAR